jgi:2-polyprenyl-6-hydroxyphenyl methylase/3-demethylubiquinone-9 3-methyltransferase
MVALHSIYASSDRFLVALAIAPNPRIQMDCYVFSSSNSLFLISGGAMERPQHKEVINNQFYNDYGHKWYTADDDPVALLRAEGKLKQGWIANRINKNLRILDVGCGAGFLCNHLSTLGHTVTGLDISQTSLDVAAAHDQTKKVTYLAGDAYHLPFEDASFDVVTNMDFLEHVDQPGLSIQECARVLRPGGKFFFHTFNRNWLSHLVVIKAVERFVKNTPKNMHVIELFLKPEEVQRMCQESGLQVKEWTGIRPEINTSLLSIAFTGKVPKSLRFKETKSRRISYMGMAIRV